MAGGLADAASDIELDVYWTAPPSSADREAAVEGAGFERVYAEEDEHEWADGLLVDGVKIDVSGFVTSTIDTYLDRALVGDTEAELQVRVTALRDGIPLHGARVIDAWRARGAGYPGTLAGAMGEPGLELRRRERLAKRGARDGLLLVHRDLRALPRVRAVMDALVELFQRHRSNLEGRGGQTVP